MNTRTLFLPLCLLAAAANAETTLNVDLAAKTAQADAPVVISLANYGLVKSALVTIDGKEIACQLDDLDGDGVADELAFVADLSQSKRRKAQVKLFDAGSPRQYAARTFAEMVLRNPKVKEKNRHDIYLQSITIDKRTENPYNVLHHHGVAFESELIAVRIYMDKRQTLDLYGKFRKGLELEQTQFYTSKEQKAEGYGDDVLWVGNTFGLGALRGWNGQEPTLLDDVAFRTQRIISHGPVRTIVEMEDRGWTIDATSAPVNMTLRYTLYAGHRDIQVDALFNRNVAEKEFSSGVINVKDSEEIDLGRGLRGCWGTDYPSTDTINWKRETVGLGIYVPKAHLKTTVAANKDNYTMVLRPTAVGSAASAVQSKITYHLAYTSANESFGPGSAKEWAAWMKKWREQVENPVKVTIAESK